MRLERFLFYRNAGSAPTIDFIALSDASTFHAFAGKPFTHCLPIL
jgi:hypothetical protein